jgi:hypothetical protein
MEGKKPGEIKVRKSDYGEGRYFIPYFRTTYDSWHGLHEDETNNYYAANVDLWELYTEPKPKVKRALYVIVPLDEINQPRLYSFYCKDEVEVYECLGISPIRFKCIRLPETEMEFDE